MKRLKRYNYLLAKSCHPYICKNRLEYVKKLIPLSLVIISIQATVFFKFAELQMCNFFIWYFLSAKPRLRR